MTRTPTRIAPPRPRGPERAAQPVRVETLGGFALTAGGRRLEFGRKAPQRPLNLLKYLAAHGGRELPDAQVATALWPDRETRPALGSLAVTIHRLRRLLGEPAAVSHRDGAVALDPRHIRCDAVDFERMLDQSAGAARESERRRLTAGALALYRGDFLAGEGRHGWVAAARSRLRERFVLGCAAQGARFAAAGRWDEARACFQRGLDVDETAEDLCLGLMISCAALGQPLTAATAYRRFVLALANRSGAKPSRPLRALHRELLMQAARPAAKRAAAA